jgi:DNA polymerase III alpha subunit
VAAADRKIAMIMRFAAQAGIKLMPPTIGRSRGEWFISKSGSLVAPLSLVVGVGDKAADAHFEAAKTVRWPTIWSFLEWSEQNKGVLNRGALQALAKAGAFNGFGMGVERAHDVVSKWAEFKPGKKNGSQVAQTKAAIRADPAAVLLTQEDGETRMAFERAALGFTYWSSPWRINDRESTVLRLLEEGRIGDDADRRLRGKRRAFVVTGISRKKDKREREMAFVSLQSVTGTPVKGVIFASEWGELRKIMRIDGVYLIAGEFDRDGSFLIGNRGGKTLIDVDTITK